MYDPDPAPASRRRLTAYSLTTATGVVEVDDASSETTGVVDDDSDSRT
jgi:hypothetical protein